MGVAETPKVIADMDDYDFARGVSIRFKHDIRKTFNNTAQNGIVTGYFASVADA